MLIEVRPIGQDGGVEIGVVMRKRIPQQSSSQVFIVTRIPIEEGIMFCLPASPTIQASSTDEIDISLTKSIRYMNGAAAQLLQVTTV